MNPLLNAEVSHALQTAGGQPLEVTAPQTNQSYFVIDRETLQMALAALKAQHDYEAIARGIAQMESGLELDEEKVYSTLRENLGLHDDHLGRSSRFAR